MVAGPVNRARDFLETDSPPAEPRGARAQFGRVLGESAPSEPQRIEPPKIIVTIPLKCCPNPWLSII